MKTFYHITEDRLLSKILKEGLQPEIGPRAQLLSNEPEAVIHCFDNKMAALRHLKGALGHAFIATNIQYDELIIIEIETDVAFEYCAQHVACFNTSIPPKSVKEAYGVCVLLPELAEVVGI